MRRMDRIIGSALCWLLSRHRQFFRRRRPIEAPGIKRILFIKLAEQGATVLAAETIQRAVERVGRENVFFLVFEENRFILDILKLLPERNIITISNNNAVSLSVGAVKSILRIRREKISATIDLEFFARATAALSYLSGAGIRMGLHSYFGEGPYRGDLMSHAVQHNPRFHASQTFAALFHAMDQAPEELPAMASVPPQPIHEYPQFRPHEKEMDAVRKKICKTNEKTRLKPIFIFHPNPDDILPLRKWKGERYVELAKRLTDRFSEINIVFTGMPAEASSIEEMVKNTGSDRCLNLAGKTTLRELLTLFTLAEVLVANDCGPAHFSSLTPINTITLFGPESPEVFASKSSRTRALWSNLSCSPCFSAFNDRRSACLKNICMEKITVDQVENAVAEAYENRKRARAKTALYP